MLLSEVTNPTRIAPVEAPISGYLGARKTILITDDDPIQRDLLREVLAPLGFILLSAPDGPGCLALAQHCRPDLFLLDISMAGHGRLDGGRDAARNGHHQARILMVSASGLPGHWRPAAVWMPGGSRDSPVLSGAPLCAGRLRLILVPGKGLDRPVEAMSACAFQRPIG